MSPQDKIDSVRQQIEEMCRGEREELECPFCGEVTTRYSNCGVCCETMATLVNGIVKDRQFKREMRKVHQIAMQLGQIADRSSMIN
jgi:hypothetical protein